jgi:hypothetical protein
MDIGRPVVRGDSNVCYINKASGKKLACTSKTDEEMVTFEGSANADIVREIVRAGPVLSVS